MSPITTITLGDSPTAGCIQVKTEADGVLIYFGDAGAPMHEDCVFVPDIAVRALIRALQEYEDAKQRQPGYGWGI